MGEEGGASDKVNAIKFEKGMVEQVGSKIVVNGESDSLVLITGLWVN